MLSDYEVVEAATVEYSIELDRGLLDGAKKYKVDDVVRPLTPTQVIDDPVNNTVRLIYPVPDITLKEDTGEVKFKSLALRQRELVVRKFVDGIAEEIHKLRQPVIRQVYADHVAAWAGDEGGVRWTQYLDVWDRLVSGNTLKYGAADDGQPMFDANHPGGDKDGNPVLYSNLFDFALSENAVAIVMRAMQDYRTTSGLPYGNLWQSSTAMTPQNDRNVVTPALTPSFHLYVGSKLSTEAARLAQMAKDNPSVFAGTFTWSTVPQLAGAHADYWFIKFIDERRRPLDFIDSGAVLISREGYDTEPGRLKGRAEWVLRAAWGLTYNRWDVMAMSTGENQASDPLTQ